jgi:hypothetical protein
MTNEQFKDTVLAEYRQAPQAQTIIRLTEKVDTEEKALNLARYSVMLDSKTFSILIDDLFATGNDWFIDYLKVVNFKQIF